MRNCECCGSRYATGKEYGNSWHSIGDPTLETKGLCEFCNPSSKWFAHQKPCHESTATMDEKIDKLING